MRESVSFEEVEGLCAGQFVVEDGPTEDDKSSPAVPVEIILLCGGAVSCASWLIRKGSLVVCLRVYASKVLAASSGSQDVRSLMMKDVKT